MKAAIVYCPTLKWNADKIDFKWSGKCLKLFYNKIHPKRFVKLSHSVKLATTHAIDHKSCNYII